MSSQTELKCSRTARSTNWSLEMKRALSRFVAEYIDTINSKANNSRVCAEKNEAWQKICQKMAAHGYHTDEKRARGAWVRLKVQTRSTSTGVPEARNSAAYEFINFDAADSMERAISSPSEEGTRHRNEDSLLRVKLEETMDSSYLAFHAFSEEDHNPAGEASGRPVKVYKKRSSGLAGAGRPKSKEFDNLGFDLAKIFNKYVAICRLCKKHLQNTAAVRLRCHRNVCKTPNTAETQISAVAKTAAAPEQPHSMEAGIPTDVPCDTQPGKENPSSDDDAVATDKKQQSPPEPDTRAVSEIGELNDDERSLALLQRQVEERRLQAIDGEIIANKKLADCKLQLLREEAAYKRKLYDAQLAAELAKKAYYEWKMSTERNGVGAGAGAGNCAPPAKDI